MGQMSKVSKNNTVVLQGPRYLRVILHQTEVVSFDRKTRQVTLNSGGWRTVTTKARMNQTAREYGLGFSVRQSKGAWYVERTATGSGLTRFPYPERCAFEVNVDANSPMAVCMEEE